MVTGVTVTRATEDDIPDILRLHAANLPHAVPIPERGFVRTPITGESLRWGIANDAEVVATDGVELVGYYLVSADSLDSEVVAHLRPAFSEGPFKELLSSGSRVGYGAQVCVAATHRRQGLGRALFGALVQVLEGRFSLLVSSITRTNRASIAFNLADTGWRVWSSDAERLFVYLDLRRGNPRWEGPKESGGVTRELAEVTAHG